MCECLDVPFVERGVRALHLIPYPFPDVWHNEGDTLEAVDFDAAYDWLVILSTYLLSNAYDD